MAGFGFGNVGFVGSLRGGGASAVPSVFYPVGTAWEESDAGKWALTSSWVDFSSSNYSGGRIFYLDPGVAGSAVLDHPVQGAGLTIYSGTAGPARRLLLEVRPYTSGGTGTWVSIGEAVGAGPSSLSFPAPGYYDVRCSQGTVSTDFTVLDRTTVI